MYFKMVSSIVTLEKSSYLMPLATTKRRDFHHVATLNYAYYFITPSCFRKPLYYLISHQYHWQLQMNHRLQ